MSSLDDARSILAGLAPEDLEIVFGELRQGRIIHEFENVIGAPAEMILEAVHRAPELTRRMLRGVIADAAFRTFVVPVMELRQWKDVTPEGNFAYDYLMQDGHGSVSVQVKLQRSEKGSPVVKDGARYGFDGNIFMTETQKTRTGNDGDAATRPYRYGEFDVLAVSMQPSAGEWDEFMYTPSRWLLPGKGANEMATMQPVAMRPNEFWTDDFSVAAGWFRQNDDGKRMSDQGARKRRHK